MGLLSNWFMKRLSSLGLQRGDGYIGEDVTANVRTVKAIPLRLKSEGWFSEATLLDVRGEIFMNRPISMSLIAAAMKLVSLLLRTLATHPRVLCASSILELQQRGR